MRLRIGYLTTIYHTAFVLMGADWIKERIGVKTDWRLFPTGPDMVKAFSRGELDLGYVGLPPAMIGIDKGLEIKCVAGGHIEGTILVAKKIFQTLKELGTINKVLSQFKGKVIGTPSKGSIHDIIIRWLINKAKLQEDITVKNFEWADLILEAMENNMIDCGCGTPPLAVLASRFLNAEIVLPPSVMWPQNPSYGIVATVEIIKDYSEILEGFLKLHEEACNLIRRKPRKAAETVAKAIGIVDKNFILEVFKVSPKYCASLPKEYVDSTLAFVPVLQKMGYISKPLSKVDIFRTDIIERIHKEKPHYNDPSMLK
jgi:NitT/TauT family transport system substrate-binding protein